MRKMWIVVWACVFILGGCTAAQLTKMGLLKQKAVVAGQLFCSKETTDGPLVMALETAFGVPVVVTGVESKVVASACAYVDAIPVSPPANPAAAPVVAVPQITVPLPVTQTSV